MLKEIVMLTKINYQELPFDAYEIPSGAIRLGKDQIVFTFSLWCNPRNLAEEEERVREHLSRRYPEFMELQKTAPR